MKSFMFNIRRILFILNMSRILKNNSQPYKGLRRCSVVFYNILKKYGFEVIIQGQENISKNDTPVVFISNHMSSIETFLLASVLKPKKITFVIKEQLMKLPFFSSIVKSIFSIPISRKNSRQDLKIVLQEGKKRLQGKISVVIFPQGTRTPDFDEKKFSSLGVKLAQNNKVDIIPIALKTNIEQKGMIPFITKIFFKRTIRFSIGEKISLQKYSAQQAHNISKEFIKNKLQSWK